MSQLLLSALAVVCPNCDGHNPPRAAACALCGTGLMETPAPRPAAPRPGTSSRPALAPTGATARPAPAAGPKPAEGARPAEPVPPGLRPSASRTPPPSAAGGIPVEPAPAARQAPTAPSRRTGSHAAVRPPAAAAAPRPPPPVPADRLPPPVPDVQPVARPAAPAPAPAAPAPAPAARPAPAASRFGLSVVAGSSRGQRYKLPVTGCVVGRSRGAILLAEDVFVSALHATFLVKDAGLFIRDENSASGVYVTIPGTEAIAPRTLFSAGSRVFRFGGRIEVPIAPPGQPVVYGAPMPLGQAIYAVEEILVGGRAGRAVVSAAALLTIGQGHCDLSYPQDEALASRHCELSPTLTGAMLRDLSGGLGTYVRIAPGLERPLRPGDRVRIGQHVFQVDLLG